VLDCAIIYIILNNLFAFIMEIEGVFCAVRTGSLEHKSVIFVFKI